ncbi:BRISC and BRCA1-A complex member 1-like [Asterias rubens]|uniref:BRISC and BRCA1-A complex member 1-like n=1 Tax=Asterias rubens TaxID=7604 RepID=UPI0014557014|nr:BRISC and BRCA1-A complex member 1-like [Asterias rubens]
MEHKLPKIPPKMTDRRSPIPQGVTQIEPTRDYDIIDDEAVGTTAPGSTSMPITGVGRKVLGQVGQSLHASADKIFRKGVLGGLGAAEVEDSDDSMSTTKSENDSDLMSGLSRSPAPEMEREMQFDQHRNHGNVEMEFGTVSHQQEIFAPTLNLPRINCPEKIIICIDLATEVNRVPFVSKEGTKHNPLELIKRALNIFVQTKSAISPKHEFALVLLQESAIWIQDFTSDVEEFVNVLLDMTNDTTECESCNLRSLFDVIQEKVKLPDIEDIECLPPPHIVRILFVYGRSRCIPQLAAEDDTHSQSQQSLTTSPYFFFDVFYVHEPPTEDNCCKEIYDVFLNLDVHNTSYIHEVGRQTTQLYDKMAMLVAHPLQRPPQTQCQYNIFRDVE